MKVIGILDNGNKEARQILGSNWAVVGSKCTILGVDPSLVKVDICVLLKGPTVHICGNLCFIRFMCSIRLFSFVSCTV